MRRLDSISLLGAVVREAPLVIYAKDRERRFVLSNTRHHMLLERAEADVIGRTDTDLLGAEAAAVEESTTRVLETGEAIAAEYTLSIAGEGRTFLETIYPLFGIDGNLIGAGGIATDITARRALEVTLEERAREMERTLQELHAAQAGLIQTERLAALGALVAAVAHEVNTPVGVAFTSATHSQDLIRDLRGHLEGGTLTRAVLAHALDAAEEAATLTVRNLGRAARLVESFRQVAVDRSSLRMRTIAVSRWLNELIESLNPMARQAGVTVEPQIRSDRVLCFAAGELQQVVTNLIVNALTHAFPGGEGERVGRRVTVVLSVEPDHLQIVIRDNGRGMSEEVARRAFEPFFTTRQGSGGSGLGLHIVRSLVNEHFSGSVELKEDEFKGTMVYVTAPIGTAAIYTPITDGGRDVHEDGVDKDG